MKVHCNNYEVSYIQLLLLDRILPEPEFMIARRQQIKSDSDLNHMKMCCSIRGAVFFMASNHIVRFDRFVFQKQLDNRN